MLEILEKAIIAFVLIFITTLAIYVIGKHSAPKTKNSDNSEMAYACGEKAYFHGLKINTSLFKYIIYFVIFDSAVLLLAFASTSLSGSTPIMLLVYLGIILAAGFAIVEGGKD